MCFLTLFFVSSVTVNITATYLFSCVDSLRFKITFFGFAHASLPADSLPCGLSSANFTFASLYNPIAAGYVSCMRPQECSQWELLVFLYFHLPLNPIVPTPSEVRFLAIIIAGISQKSLKSINFGLWITIWI